jgi:superfamily II DNA or RNA helicase
MYLYEPPSEVIAPEPLKIFVAKTLRDYQFDAMCASRKEFASGITSTLVVLPTGMGKTVLFAKMASEWEHGNVLIIAHRVELLEQAADKLASELGYRPPIEQGQRGLDEDSMWQGGNVVVGSVATLKNLKRINKYREFPFGLVIIDEAHHAMSASYKRVMEACQEFNPDCKFLGVTATPNRTDNAALGIVFNTVAYAMDIRRGIQLGWLVPIKQEYVHLAEDAVDFSNLTLTRNKFGEADFPKEQLEAILTEENALHAMSRPILDMTQAGEQCLIFNAGVAHAHLMAQVLNRYKPNSAAAVDGKTAAQQRFEIVSKFHKKELQYLLNFGVFTEGFDAPATSMIVMARPTKSVSLYTQMLGRGTRPLGGVVDGPATPELRRATIAASAKPFMTVLDFVGNSRHKPASAVDALGGDYDFQVKALAEERVRQKGGDIQEALEEARVDYALLAEEKKRKAVVAAAVRYSRTAVDVFGAESGGVGNDTSIARGGASNAQIGLLVNLGVEYGTAAGYSKRQAGAVIDSISKTRCTNKQRNILIKYGHEPSGISMKEASKIIDGIAANGWKKQ